MNDRGEDWMDQQKKDLLEALSGAEKGTIGIGGSGD